MSDALLVLKEQIEPRWRAANGEARRLFHGRGHCFPGWEHLVVNWFPPYLQVATFREEQLPDDLVPWLTHLHEAIFDQPLAGLVWQQRKGRGTTSETLFGGVPEEHVVHEQGLAYLVRPLENQNVGLFMDMAHIRRWLAPQIAGQRVLNLFAYTCAFSVSAIAHGAEMVVNNDMSRNALSWGERNHDLNDLDLRRARMVPHNLFKSWWKLKQFGPYDTLIIDPPTNQRGSFVAEKSYGQVLKRLPDLCASDALVLACLNSPFLGEDFLHQQMARWCPQARFVERLPAHPDFPEQFPDRGLKVLAFRYNR